MLTYTQEKFTFKFINEDKMKSQKIYVGNVSGSKDPLLHYMHILNCNHVNIR